MHGFGQTVATHRRLGFRSSFHVDGRRARVATFINLIGQYSASSKFLYSAFRDNLPPVLFYIVSGIHRCRRSSEMDSFHWMKPSKEIFNKGLRAVAFDIQVATSVRGKRKEIKEMLAGLSAFNICFSTHLFTSAIGPFTLSVCWLACTYQLKTRLISSVASSTLIKSHVLNCLFSLLGIWTFSLPCYSRGNWAIYFHLPSCERARRMASHAMVTSSQAAQAFQNSKLGELHTSVPIQFAAQESDGY